MSFSLSAFVVDGSFSFWCRDPVVTSVNSSYLRSHHPASQPRGRSLLWRQITTGSRPLRYYVLQRDEHGWPQTGLQRPACHIRRAPCVQEMRFGPQTWRLCWIPFLQNPPCSLPLTKPLAWKRDRRNAESKEVLESLLLRYSTIFPAHKNRAPLSGGFLFHFQNTYHWRVTFPNVGLRSGLQVRPGIGRSQR